MARPDFRLPIETLHDRTARDLYDEAVGLLNQYAGDAWTNRNPADPGMTLVELFCWLTDVMLYRLDRVPDRNYLAFLDLLGVSLRPPQPARTRLQLEPTRGGAGRVVPAGLRAATAPRSGEQPLVFETSEPLLLTGARVAEVVGWSEEGFDRRPDGDLSAGPLHPFGGGSRVDRYLYVGDDRLATLQGPAEVNLSVRGPTGSPARLARQFEWEYSTQDGWRPLPGGMGRPDDEGRLRLGRLPALAPVEIGDVSVPWLRGRLSRVPDDPADLELEDLLLSVEVIGTGVRPDGLFVSPGGGVFVPADPHRMFLPFGEQPGPDACLYIGSPEFLRTEQARLEFQVQVPRPDRLPKPQPSRELLLAWEYWDGQEWQDIWASSRRLLLVPQGPHRFVDSTEAFSRSGTVALDVPEGIRSKEIGGVDLPWIRVRIDRGDYGMPASFRLVGDQWLEEEVRPLRPPGIEGLGFQYRGERARAAHCLAENDFVRRDIGDELGVPFRPFSLFERRIEATPALYVGLDRPLEPGEHGLWLELEETGEDYSAPFEEAIADQQVRWEFLARGGWQELSARDETLHLKRAGLLRIRAPEEHEPEALFGGEPRFWLRARLLNGGHDVPVALRGLLTNTVGALQQETERHEPPMSSDGLPLQEFRLRRAPALAAPEVWVRESERPAPSEGVDPDADVEPAQDGDGYLVRWRPAQRLLESGPRSRHFTFEPMTGALRFGDGTHGMIPPSGSRNIIARSYPTGGGASGNVGTGAVRRLLETSSAIASITNPLPADGGADAETLDELRARGVATVHNKERAVRAEDFEWLARQASGRVARVRCLPPRAGDDPVQLVVVPREPDEAVEQGAPRVPRPSRELIRRVQAAIEPKMLINTRLEVRGPSWRRVDVALAVYIRPEFLDEASREIRASIRRFLHPLHGDVSGKGWPFGKAVERADLFAVVEAIEGVQFVADLSLRSDLGGGLERASRVPIEPDELPELGTIDLTPYTRRG